MKIVSWNSSAALKSGGRLEQLLAMKPDIAIIPECSVADVKNHYDNGGSAQCFEVKTKAIGVFAWNGWEIEHMSREGFRFAGVAPFQVRGPVSFTLLAVWSVAQFGGYARQLHDAFSNHPEWFANKHVVVAGDFNTTGSGKQPVSAHKHSDLVELLRTKELKSAYHMVTAEDHGKETRHSYHHQRKATLPFHIDYIFLPLEWERHISELSVGPHAFWSAYSDHRPISVSLHGLNCKV